MADMTIDYALSPDAAVAAVDKLVYKLFDGFYSLAEDVLNDTIEVDVGFDYQPYERQEAYYPGCDEDVTPESVKYKGVEIIDLLPDDDIAEIRVLILEKIRDIRERDKAEDEYERRNNYY